MIDRPLEIEELCSAPNIAEVVPLTAPGLEEFISDNQQRADAKFSLANIYLQSSNYDRAETLYLEALEQSDNQAEIYCNLGILYRLTANLEAAGTAFKKALEISPDLATAHYHLAHVLLAQGADGAAKTKLEQLVRLKPGHYPARVLLGELLLSSGSKEDALSQFNAAISIEPDYLPAHIKLGEVGFKEGKWIYGKGDFHGALSRWQEAFSKHPAALRSSPLVVRELEKIYHKFREDGVFERELQKFALKTQDERPQSSDYYELMCRFLFSTALMPEMYVAENETAEDYERWTQQLETGEAYPYAKFRRSLALCYRGELDEAFDELAEVRDTLPETKRASLRISECISFVQKLRRIIREGAGEIVQATKDDWEANGILGDLQRKAWEKTGVSPQEAGLWKSEAFSPEEAVLWRRYNLSFKEAAAWRGGGFFDPKEAVRWQKGGFTPEEAAGWSKQLEQPIETVIQCRAVGFEDPHEAAQWLRVFMFPSEAAQWRDAGLTPAEAVIAIGDGIHDAFVAAQRKKEKQQAEED